MFQRFFLLQTFYKNVRCTYRRLPSRARQKRIDVIGCIYHDISRGIERKKVFRDDSDKREFINRLNHHLSETKTQCYAWVLMDNHFHLLLRPLKNPLSVLMRKVLSGYVGYFNARHKRVEHLFQNHYKSILCQENVYFKELIRYIHLNPVRSKIVITPVELKDFPWSGYGALIGRKPKLHQEIEEVLGYFGSSIKEARSRYLNYMKKGWNVEYRKDFNGGGLLRSAGGLDGLRVLKKLKEKWQYDARILGDGDFVSHCLKKYDEKDNEKMFIKNRYTLETLADLVCNEFKITKEELYSGRRLRYLTLPKGVFIYLATEYLDFTLKVVGEKLKNKSTNAIYLAKEKGREYINENGNILITE